MTDAHLTIRLRPTRIGFLVNPTDMASIRKIMRYCACLWGGLYNPIIPVFRNPPKEWRPERFDRFAGYQVARGYIRFFEPDVFVEATAGMAEKVGLLSLRERPTFHPQVVSLEDFLAPRDHRDWAEPAFGLNIVDVFRHLYEAEQRFQHRTPNEVLSIKPDRSSGVTEAVFGVFPSGKFVDYIANGYKDVFNPTTVNASANSWKNVFEGHSLTPLRVTRHGADGQRFWHDDVVVFVFDPSKSTDLIDLWNLRLEPNPVLPVPVDWVEEVSDFVKRLLNETHRPIQGNPNGVMHQATVEFGRSLPKDVIDSVVEKLSMGVDKGALCVKSWRNRIWEKHVGEPWVASERRMLITADEGRVTVPIKESRGELSATFEALSPPFAAKYAGHDYRWINVVGLSVYNSHDIATVFPFNTYDRSWPRLRFGGYQVLVGSEGWIFSQRYKNSSENLLLMRSEEALIGTLKQYGIDAKLSDPGHIAQQMLQHLNGLWATHLLADAETLQLLNKMAGGLRRKSNETDTIEEQFDRKTVSRKDWLDLIAKRVTKNRLPRLNLADFTDRKIIRLGLETECPNCKVTNWHGLGDVDYEVTCERCLNVYGFPQAELREHNKNWAYRVIGPFSVPDYGRGAYGVLLTLRALAAINVRHELSTFSTALDLKIGDTPAEIDFAVLHHEGERLNHTSEPQLLIGEAKSFGAGDLVKTRDLNRLKLVASKLPNTFVVISVLRDSFTPSEIKRLKSFVQWGRRPNVHGQPTNPVILLTGVELFAEDYIQSEWENLLEPYKSFSDSLSIRTLYCFADATQQIYLGLPSYHKWREEIWKIRSKKKKTTSSKKD